MYQPTKHQLSAFRINEYNRYLETVRDFPKSRPKVLLQYAIAKWQAVINFLLTDKLRSSEHGGVWTCALCMNYTNCRKCPIGQHTGKISCHGTPYIKFNAAGTKSTRLKYAKAEVKFLQKIYAERYG